MLDETAAENRRVDLLSGKSSPPLDIAVSNGDDLAALRARWASMDSIPKLLSARPEGVDHSWKNLDIRTLLRGEESTGRFSCHDIVLAPGAALPPHFHEVGNTYWWVIEGTVDLRIGHLTERVSRYGFGYAPACTRQGIKNPTSKPARVYVAYSPAGADHAFASAHAHWAATGEQDEQPYLAILARYGFNFDAHTVLANDARTNEPASRIEAHITRFEEYAALRDAWSRRPGIPKLLTTPQRSSLDVPGDENSIAGSVLLSGDEGGGSAVAFVGQAEPGYGAPAHHQPSEEELFYVVEGELDLTCGSMTRRVGPGAFGFAPRNATHAFHNPTSAVTTFLTVNSPAGHERGFEVIAREHQSDRLGELLVAHGWRMHPPQIETAS
jgi:mannose-6-phosphate isomerase-like protein (cupin superfamily)